MTDGRYTMSSLIGLETSLFNMKAGVTTLIDPIGGKDSDIVEGSPNATSKFLEFLASDAIGWTALGSPIDMSADHAGYMTISLLGNLNGVTNQFFGSSAGGQHPFIIWDDAAANSQGTPNVLYYNPNNSGGINNQIVPMGGEINDPIKIAIAFSHTGSNRSSRLAAKTSTGITVSRTGDQYSAGFPPTNDILNIGRHSSFGNCRYFGDLGFLTSAKSIGDLEDTVFEIAQGFGNPEQARRRGIYLFDAGARAT